MKQAISLFFVCNFGANWKIDKMEKGSTNGNPDVLQSFQLPTWGPWCSTLCVKCWDLWAQETFIFYMRYFKLSRDIFYDPNRNQRKLVKGQFYKKEAVLNMTYGLQKLFTVFFLNIITIYSRLSLSSLDLLIFSEVKVEYSVQKVAKRRGSIRFSYWFRKIFHHILLYVLLVTTMTFGFLKIAQVLGHLWIHNCSTQLFPEGPKVNMWALKSGHLTKYFLHCQGHNSNILWDLMLSFPFWISFIYTLHFCVLKVHHVT